MKSEDNQWNESFVIDRKTARAKIWDAKASEGSLYRKAEFFFGIALSSKDLKSREINFQISKLMKEVADEKAMIRALQN